MADDRRIYETAAALIEAAKDADVVALVVEDCRQLSIAFSATSLLVNLNENAIALETRLAALDVLAKDLNPLTLNALRVMLSDGGLPDMADFGVAVMRAAARAGHHVVLTTTTVELNDEERDKLRAVLEQKLGGTIALVEQISPDILGGLVLESPGWNADHSVRRTLAQLTRQLTPNPHA